jgi:acetolactate synthase-1/3 small subunit
VEIFRGRVLELTPEWVLVEITGSPQELEGLLQILQPYGVLEAVSTGPIVIRRNSPKLAKPRPAWEIVPKAVAAGANPSSIGASIATMERKHYGTDLL